MMKRLTGQVAIVTGASRGIGKAIAKGLAEQGCKVVVSARSEDALQQVENELSSIGEAVAIVADVTDEKDVQNLFRQTAQQFSKLDLLVNNAGAFDGGGLDELSLETWEKVMAVNLRGPFLCTREAMRIMKPQGKGRIINIGSISAQRVRLNSAPYATSKHGLWGLTQATALEGREFGITCGCLHPGNVAVERRNTEQPEDAEPMMQPEEIAEVAVLMAGLPPHVEMLEAVVLPHQQHYVGRG